MDGFHMTYYIDFYAQRPDILEAKNGSCPWENLENLLLKEIAILLQKKKITSLVTLLHYLKITYFLYCN